MKIKYIIFTFLAVVIGISLFSMMNTFTGETIKENHSEKGDSLISFDKELAKELIDKGLTLVLGSDHIHAALEINMNGEKINLNNEKYFVKSAFVHVEEGEDAGEMIHIHAKGVPLWVFFDSLDIKFNSSSFVFEGKEYPNNENNKLRFLVNENENTEFENYIPKDQDKILIIY